jgi:hypothetical protein
VRLLIATALAAASLALAAPSFASAAPPPQAPSARAQAQAPREQAFALITPVLKAMARKSATAWFGRFESWTETKVGRAADAVVSGLAPGNVFWLRCWRPGQAVDNGAFHSVYWFWRSTG